MPAEGDAVVVRLAVWKLAGHGSALVIMGVGSDQVGGRDDGQQISIGGRPTDRQGWTARRVGNRTCVGGHFSTWGFKVLKEGKAQAVRHPRRSQFCCLRPGMLDARHKKADSVGNEGLDADVVCRMP